MGQMLEQKIKYQEGWIIFYDCRSAAGLLQTRYAGDGKDCRCAAVADKQ